MTDILMVKCRAQLPREQLRPILYRLKTQILLTLFFMVA